MHKTQGTDFVIVRKRVAQDFPIEGFNNKILPVLIIKMFPKEKGEENLQKGKSYEDKIRTKIKMAMGKEGLFRDYQAVGEINSVNLSGETKGKKKQRGYEVDAYGTLQKIGTKKTVQLVVEIKKRKSKVSGKDAEKFLGLLKFVQQKNKGQEILAIYLDEQGEFAKPAIELLSQNKVLFGTIQDVLNKKK